MVAALSGCGSGLLYPNLDLHPDLIPSTEPLAVPSGKVLLPSGPRAGASRWQCGLKYCHCHRGEGKHWVLGVQGTHILVSLCSHESPCDVLGVLGSVLGSSLCCCMSRLGLGGR